MSAVIYQSTTERVKVWLDAAETFNGDANRYVF